jgi:glycosyltransferase involved in cell wall biosynthesis
MPEISVVIATKNEERNIRDCLESVKWADEIIIVDDASRDKTVEICREYTDKIFINDAKGDFHRNKNLGLEKANRDWILSLDADERITEKLSEEIQVAVQDEEKVGYYLNRKNYFLGKWIRGCGWYPDYIIRLFRKGTTRWPLLAEDFHGTPKIKEKRKTGYLKNEFIHYSYFSIGQYIEKFNLYTSALAKQEYHRQAKINLFICFLFKPSLLFFRKYFLMAGYRDGFRGFFISVASALTIFMTFAKLWEMYRKD